VLTLPPSTKTYLATKRVDGRKGIDGLVTIVRSQFKHEPFDGHVYAFITRRGDGIRLIFWDRSGYMLILKRLEKGTFRMPWDECEGPPRIVESAELMLLIEGIDLRGAKRRGRWLPRSRAA
jgi:transposase